MENTYKCEICGLIFNKSKSLETHKYNKHRFYNKSVDFIITKNRPLKSWLLKGIDINLVKQFYKLHKEFNNFSLLLDRQFLHFYGLISSVRDFQEGDFNTFFSKFLEWKEKNPKQVNSKELCNLVFTDKKEAQIAYSKMKERNPFTGHSGEFSPFSKKFCGYKDKSEEEIEQLRIKAAKHNEKGRNTNQVEYWVKKGYSEEKAKIKVSERQRTFTIEKCIEKYGKEEGTKRWQERQQKWQNTLKSKPIKEQERIGRAKMSNGRSYSIISQTLFWEIYNKIKHFYNKISFATLDKNGESDWSGKSHEKIINHEGNLYFYDFCIDDNKKIIEFDGDYWHSLETVKKKDITKSLLLESMGYKLYRVNEKDFKSDPQEIINNCIEFLQS